MTRFYACTAIDLDRIGWVGANDAWKSAQTDAGVLCSHCGAIQPGMLERLQTIVVDNKRPLTPHIGIIGGLRPCEAMSMELLDAIGRERASNVVPLFGGCHGTKHSPRFRRGEVVEFAKDPLLLGCGQRIEIAAGPFLRLGVWRVSRGTPRHRTVW